MQAGLQWERGSCCLSPEAGREPLATDRSSKEQEQKSNRFHFIFFMYMGVLSIYMSMYHVCTMYSPERSEEGIESLGPGIMAMMSHPVGAGNPLGELLTDNLIHQSELTQGQGPRDYM